MKQTDYMAELFDEVDQVYTLELLDFLQSRKKKQYTTQIIMVAVTILAAGGFVTYTDLGKRCAEKVNFKKLSYALGKS